MKSIFMRCPALNALLGPGGIHVPSAELTRACLLELVKEISCLRGDAEQTMKHKTVKHKIRLLLECSMEGEHTLDANTDEFGVFDYSLTSSGTPCALSNMGCKKRFPDTIMECVSLEQALEKIKATLATGHYKVKRVIYALKTADSMEAKTATGDICPKCETIGLPGALCPKHAACDELVQWIDHNAPAMGTHEEYMNFVALLLGKIKKYKL